MRGLMLLMLPSTCASSVLSNRRPYSQYPAAAAPRTATAPSASQRRSDDLCGFGARTCGGTSVASSKSLVMSSIGFLSALLPALAHGRQEASRTVVFVQGPHRLRRHRRLRVVLGAEQDDLLQDR